METITEDEKTKFRELLVKIFGAQASRWNINKKVLELIGELIESSDYCSRYMDQVPRPFVAGNVQGWASRQFRHAILRKVANADKYYYVCLKTAGLKMKSNFVLASAGA